MRSCVRGQWPRRLSGFHPGALFLYDDRPTVAYVQRDLALDQRWLSYKVTSRQDWRSCRREAASPPVRGEALVSTSDTRTWLRYLT